MRSYFSSFEECEPVAGFTKPSQSAIIRRPPRIVDGQNIAEGQSIPHKGHDLLKLAQSIKLYLSANEVGLLGLLSEAVVWDGRYPVPLAEGRLNKLSSLFCEHLSDRKKIGSLVILSPNNHCGWDEFRAFWCRCNDRYWSSQIKIQPLKSP